MKEEDNVQFPNVTHYTKVDVQPGGINIQNVENLYQADVLKALGIKLKIDGDTPSPEDCPNDDAIPQDCKDAVVKVFTDWFTYKGGVLNSQKQVRKGAEKINLSSNSEIALLMAIGREVGTVRPGTNCPDFIRALIGLTIIPYDSTEKISQMADGMAKKLNGYKQRGKSIPGLAKNHLQWISNDRTIGEKVYEAMISNS